MRLLLLVFALMFAAPASAKTATLQGVTTNTCAFSASAVAANGDLIVTCVKPPAPPSPPPTSCPASSVVPINMGGSGATGPSTNYVMPSGGVTVFAFPTMTAVIAGKPLQSFDFKIAETTTSYPVAPWSIEIYVSRCKGVIRPPAEGVIDRCYAVNGNRTYFEMTIAQGFGKFPYDTEAGLAKERICYAPKDQGPWYINMKYNYSGCTAQGGKCGWHTQWNYGSF